MSFFNLKQKEKRELEKDFLSLVDDCFTLEKNIFELEFPNNIIEWAVSDKFHCSDTIYENRGQYYALREFFQCYCPICSNIKGKQVFMVDRKDLINDKLLVWDWSRKVEYCPSCGLTKDDFIQDGLLKEYNMMLGIIGMRAGKTWLASVIMSYVEQFLIRIGDIRKVLGLSSLPFLELACIAVSATQAKDTIWAQYKALRDNSEWFKDLDEKMQDAGHKKSGQYDASATSSVSNELCGYKVVSLTSSSASIAGRTRVLFVIDELGRFDTTDSKRSASEVWRVGSNSLKTVRKAVSRSWLPFWFGSLVGIESPISVDDYGMKMLANSDNVDNMFKMKFATWEFNKEYEPEDFKGEFELDYFGTQRDFGADPPGAETPYIEDWDLFLSLTEDKSLVPTVYFEEERRVVGDVCYIGKELVSCKLDKNEWAIAGDCGKSRDTFSLVGCKKVFEDGQAKMVQGFAMHILPDKSKKMYVDYTCITDIIKKICNMVKVAKISFDYWDSDSIIQELQKEGLPAEQYQMSSARVEDFFAFKSAYQGGRIRLLPRRVSEDSDAKMMDSQSRQYWELKRMQRSKDLKRVDHSNTSTSDITECIVNCHRILFGTERSNRAVKQTFQQPSNQFGGIVRFRRW